MSMWLADAKQLGVEVLEAGYGLDDRGTHLLPQSLGCDAQESIRSVPDLLRDRQDLLQERIETLEIGGENRSLAGAIGVLVLRCDAPLALRPVRLSQGGAPGAVRRFLFLRSLDLLVFGLVAGNRNNLGQDRLGLRGF